MFKNLTGFAQLLKNAGSLGEKMKESKEKLRRQRVSGETHTRDVLVEMNGLGEVQRIVIAEELRSADHGHLQSQLVVAVNQAIVAARRLHVEAIRDVTGGVELPGMKELLEDLVD